MKISALLMSIVLLLVLIVSPEPYQPLPRAEAATFTVTNLNDSGAGSLRQAIADAYFSPGSDVINFSVTGTINLASSLGVNDNLTINGSGITLNGGNATRIMSFNPGFTVVLNDLSFQNGSSSGGAAIFNNGSTLTINNSSFSNNQATTFSSSYGGAIRNDGILTITGSTFSGNTASGSAGAIFNNYIGTLTITDSTFSGNMSNGNGGAIRNDGILTNTGSTFSGNQATSFGTGLGGAISNNGGTATITNSTFSGNSAVAIGGALYNGAAILTITSSTFGGNTGGGTLYNGGTANVASSLIVDGWCSGTITDGGHNLSFNATGCPGTVANPQLGPLQNNGGPTNTMLPAFTSPAVDAYAAPCATTTDQRGINRPQGWGCDIGATEQIGPTPLVASAACVGNDLRVTITDGDSPFRITFNGAIQATSVATGTYTFSGPNLFQSVTVIELSGNLQSANFGTFNCGTPGVTINPTTVAVDEAGPTSAVYFVVLDSSPNAGETVTISPGGFDPVLGVTVAPVSLLFTSINWQITQTFTVTAVDDTVDEADPHTDTIMHTVTTTGGAYAGVSSASSVTASIADNEAGLITSAVCNGPDLEVTITSGDGPFNITASAGVNMPVNGVNTGTTTINGPEKWDNPTVTETTGDLQSINLGQFRCRSSEVPVPVSPAHRARTTNPFPTFSWTGISIANNYRVFVFDDANPATRTVDIRQNSGGLTSMQLSSPLPNGRLFWRVRGRQNRIWSLWSIRFTLFKDPSPPLTITTPVPTLDLNPPAGDGSVPSPAPTVGPAPTFPAPPNSR